MLLGHPLLHAADLTCDAAAEMIPYQLFNFMAWLTGYSDEIPDEGDLVQVKEPQKAKLLSVYQDIIYLLSKGKTEANSQTPCFRTHCSTFDRVCATCYHIKWSWPQCFS